MSEAIAAERRRKARDSMRAWRAQDPERARAYARAWAKANPDKVAASQRKTYLRGKNSFRRARISNVMRCRYGISLADFEDLLIAQSGRCAICRKQLVRPCIDHHHRMGKVRGLLCDGCNICVGHLENDSKREAALCYLSEHEDE